jgi:hypothetical protein
VNSEDLGVWGYVLCVYGVACLCVCVCVFVCVCLRVCCRCLCLCVMVSMYAYMRESLDDWSRAQPCTLSLTLTHAWTATLVRLWNTDALLLH